MQHPRLYFSASEVSFNSILSAERITCRLVPWRTDSAGELWFRRTRDIELDGDGDDDIDLDGDEIRAELAK